jgi:hypothetical protein
VRDEARQCTPAPALALHGTMPCGGCAMVAVGGRQLASLSCHLGCVGGIVAWHCALNSRLREGAAVSVEGPAVSDVSRRSLARAMWHQRMHTWLMSVWWCGLSSTVHWQRHPSLAHCLVWCGRNVPKCCSKTSQYCCGAWARVCASALHHGRTRWAAGCRTRLTAGAVGNWRVLLVVERATSGGACCRASLPWWGALAL